MRSLRNEQGFALATAILALVVVGALVTAGFFAANTETRVGVSNAQADMAFYIAEQGMENTFANVRKRHLRGVAVGQVLTRNGNVTVGTRNVGNWVVTIRPLGGGDLFYVESLGTVTEGGRYAGATRRLGTVARTIELNFPMDAAFTAGGDLTVAGNATVSGVDTNPSTTIWPGSECDPTVGTEAGIRIPPTETFTREGNSSLIVGNPPVEPDASITPETFNDFGDYDLATLRAMASHVIAGGSVFPQPTYTNGVCRTSDPHNWGAPSNTDPCKDYFPIIYSDGNLALGSNRSGQGILIVNGNLTMNGSFQFYGITIVTGEFNRGSGGGGFRFHGTMLVGGGSIGDSQIDGQPNIQFSTCAVNRALRENEAVARLFPVQQRSWVDLTAAGVEL